MPKIRRIRDRLQKPVNGRGSQGMAVLIFSLQFKPSRAVLMASCIRAAAFPVGAARTILRGRPLFNSKRRARILAMVNVLPVPGPPEMTQNFLRAAVKAATFCQSVSPEPNRGKAW